MNIIETIRRRQRTKGFGVQSPFAYAYLTTVVRKAKSYDELLQLTSEFAAAHKVSFQVSRQKPTLPNPSFTFDLYTCHVAFYHTRYFQSQHYIALFKK